MLKFIAVPMALLCSLSLHAATTVETWDFTRNSVDNVGNAGSRTMTTANNQLTITAWSSESNGTIQQANFRLNTWGTNVCAPGENVNNSNHCHGVDNFTGSQFILLEFAQPVMLDSLVTSWNEYRNSNRNLTSVDAYLTVAGFDDNPFSRASSWHDVAQKASVKAAYQNSYITENGTDRFSNRDAIRETEFKDEQLIQWNTGNQGITGSVHTTWLIGAYNHVFNVNGSPNFSGFDKLKFSSLTTSFNNTPVADVPAPATLALFGLGLLLLMRRRQKFVS